MTDAGAAPGRVEVFGIRHHGPGSARSLLRALDDSAPDAVLVEGPSDADPLLALASATGMAPPVALLGYAADDPGIAAFWPYAVFSPEWQALAWAHRARVPVGFCDLPATATLAARSLEMSPGVPSGIRRDPVGQLAAAAGYDDPERWWDDVVELRTGGGSPFPALTEAMAALREDETEQDEPETLLREAWMRQVLRRTLRAGHPRVAVVCGAWHAPALTGRLPPATADARLLRGLPRRTVRLTWVPWSHSRLATASGYGAGVASPGWYHHLWTTPDQPVSRWLTSVAHALRQRGLSASTAHVVDAVRLAESLAALRGRPLAGLAEVSEATRAVLCEGEEVAARFVIDRLVVGERLGSVPPDVPTVPLEADLARTCRSLRLRREPEARTLDLDLRRPVDLARSRLFHRLRLLGLGWAFPEESEVRNAGTFRETWRLAWRPELALAVVEGAAWGTTVPAAATARVLDLAGAAALGPLTEALEACLHADLPDAWGALLAALDRQAVLDADVLHLMAALPALARAQRYGDVRGTDLSALTRVAATLLLRVCTGLPRAVTGLGEDAAVALRRHIDAVHASVGLLAGGSGPSGTTGRERWFATLAGLADRDDVPGVLVGRTVRILRDAGRLDDATARLARALSVGVPAAQKAGWVDGFLADGALVLVHDRDLLGLLDGWVGDLSEAEFVDVLPLVRRTFGAFTPAERRSVAAAVRSVAATDGPAPEAEGSGGLLDEPRARAALATVARILGVEP